MMTMIMMMMTMMITTWSPSPMSPTVFPRLPPPPAAVFKKSNSCSLKCFQHHSGSFAFSFVLEPQLAHCSTISIWNKTKCDYLHCWREKIERETLINSVCPKYHTSLFIFSNPDWLDFFKFVKKNNCEGWLWNWYCKMLAGESVLYYDIYVDECQSFYFLRDLDKGQIMMVYGASTCKKLWPNPFCCCCRRAATKVVSSAPTDQRSPACCWPQRQASKSWLYLRLTLAMDTRFNNV